MGYPMLAQGAQSYIFLSSSFGLMCLLIFVLGLAVGTYLAKGRRSNEVTSEPVRSSDSALETKGSALPELRPPLAPYISRRNLTAVITRGNRTVHLTKCWSLKQRSKEPTEDEQYSVCKCCLRSSVQGASKNLGALLAGVVLADQLVPGQTRADFGNAELVSNTIGTIWMLVYVFMGAVSLVTWKLIRHIHGSGSLSVLATKFEDIGCFIRLWISAIMLSSSSNSTLMDVFDSLTIQVSEAVSDNGIRSGNLEFSSGFVMVRLKIQQLFLEFFESMFSYVLKRLFLEFFEFMFSYALKIQRLFLELFEFMFSHVLKIQQLFLRLFEFMFSYVLKIQIQRSACIFIFILLYGKLAMFQIQQEPVRPYVNYFSTEFFEIYFDDVYSLGSQLATHSSQRSSFFVDLPRWNFSSAADALRSGLDHTPPTKMGYGKKGKSDTYRRGPGPAPGPAQASSSSQSAPDHGYGRQKKRFICFTFSNTGRCKRGGSCDYLHVNETNWYSSAEYGRDVYHRAARAGKVHRKQWTAWAISKALTQIGRHAAEELGLEVRSNGFIRLADVVNLWEFRDLDNGDVDEGIRTMIQVIKTDAEGRYDLEIKPYTTTSLLGLTKEGGGPSYRCSTGHSLNCIKSEDMGWELLTRETCPAWLIHGTDESGLSGMWKTRFIRSRKSQAECAGLSDTKARRHIHLMKCDGLDAPVPRKCRKRDLLMYLDAHKVLRTKAQIYREEKTGVILVECDIPWSCVVAVRQTSNWGWRLWPQEDSESIRGGAAPPKGGIPSFHARYLPRQDCRACPRDAWDDGCAPAADHRGSGDVSDSMPDLESASSSDEQMSEPDQDDNQTFAEWAKTVEEEKRVAEPVRIEPASETARVLTLQIKRDMQNKLNRRAEVGEKKSHFRKLQRMYHPDKAEDKDVGTIVFQWLADQELAYCEATYVRKNTGGNVAETRPDPGGWRNNIAVDREGNPLDIPLPPPPPPPAAGSTSGCTSKGGGPPCKRAPPPGPAWIKFVHPKSGPDRYKQPPPEFPTSPSGLFSAGCSEAAGFLSSAVFSPPVFAPPSSPPPPQRAGSPWGSPAFVTKETAPPKAAEAKAGAYSGADSAASSIDTKKDVIAAAERKELIKKEARARLSERDKERGAKYVDQFKKDPSFMTGSPEVKAAQWKATFGTEYKVRLDCI